MMEILFKGSAFFGALLAKQLHKSVDFFLSIKWFYLKTGIHLPVRCLQHLA